MIHPTAIVHPSALVDSTAEIGPYSVIGANVVIGAHVRVWAFVNILADVQIGDWCSIGAHSEIGRGTTIGTKSRIGYGCFLPSHATIGKWVFIGPAVSCADDMTPRVPGPCDPHYTPLPPTFEDGCSVGIGCVLLPGIKIGLGARVAAGSLVTTNVTPGGKVRGVGTSAKPFQPSARAMAGGW